MERTFLFRTYVTISVGIESVVFSPVLWNNPIRRSTNIVRQQHMWICLRSALFNKFAFKSIGWLSCCTNVLVHSWVWLVACWYSRHFLSINVRTLPVHSFCILSMYCGLQNSLWSTRNHVLWSTSYPFNQSLNQECFANSIEKAIWCCLLRFQPQ